MIREPLIFEISEEGKKAFTFPKPDVPDNDGIEQNVRLRKEIHGFPKVAEIEVVRHFTRLSKTNYCVDEGIYPLGSCTMKYNPKINEVVAGLAEFRNSHPLSPVSTVQGNLEALFTTEQLLAEITGMDAVSLQPSAGAQGEMVGIMLVKACLEDRGEKRTTVLIPDSAHGTNPSSAHLCGFKVREIKSNQFGTVDIDSLTEAMSEDVAALMVTNPNTLGIFEWDIKKIADIVHSKGGFVYMDGANMNALVGRCRPGDMGVDVIHLNLHKTFSTPHGGGGPGAGPVGVSRALEPYLPVPLIRKVDGAFRLDEDRPKSIGRVRGFYGNFLVILKALAYILTHGPKGLREIADIAVLNSNYIRKSLEGLYHLKYASPSMHECVFSDALQKKYGVNNLDIAKRLIDYDVHPPTMSFPLIVPGALMIEPTETESRRDLDHFIEAMTTIAREAEENPNLLKQAPHHTYVRRLDETAAARQPILKWTNGDRT
ncbi:MAG: aminomethyl-transferring glycine dehydrogenase subunit GcvPB [Acidobacteriota bacterium]